MDYKIKEKYDRFLLLVFVFVIDLHYFVIMAL